MNSEASGEIEFARISRLTYVNVSKSLTLIASPNTDTLRGSRPPRSVSHSLGLSESNRDDAALIERHRSRPSSDVSKSTPGQLAQFVSSDRIARIGRIARQKLQGWRFGVACCAGMASIILLLNLTLAAWTATHFRASIQDGVGSAFVGKCETVNRWSTWLHIVINGLSAILLSASNYTMQCLNAPTRKEIDRAHAKGKWLDVGVASFRNMSWIHWHRVCLWWVLALSSAPIHLLYNSAVFKTIEADNYLMAVVNEDFLQGAPFYNYYPDSYAGWGGLPFDYDLRAVQKNASAHAAYKNSSLWERLDNSECIGAYGTSYVSGRTNVLAITSTKGHFPNQTAFWEQMIFVPSLYTTDLRYGWICANDAPNELFTECNVAQKRQNAADWTIGRLKIDYCLSQIVPAHCELQFSVYILATVVVMNACKSLAMLLALYQGSDNPLVTTGDALASFLDRPDDSTKGRCLMAKDDVDAAPTRWSSSTYPPKPVPPPVAVTYSTRSRRRWFAAASGARWFITIGLISVALIGAIVLLIIGYNFLKGKLSPGQSVFSLGFGELDARALIVSEMSTSGTGALVADVLLANLPQLICSILYFAYNRLFTCMLLCSEYSQYALKDRKKALRVTQRKGEQRSTYYLHLPFTYSIPLIVCSALLHWLISQSIFLVKITVLQTSDDQSHLGYSCAPILATIILGSVLLLVLFGLGCRKFASHIPVASSCSAALSAACHPPTQDTHAAYLSVRWGAVDVGDDEEIGHCCFTSEEIHEPTVGRMYAGLGRNQQTR